MSKDKNWDEDILKKKKKTIVYKNNGTWLRPQTELKEWKCFTFLKKESRIKQFKFPPNN